MYYCYNYLAYFTQNISCLSGRGKVLFISVALRPRYFRKCFALFMSVKRMQISHFIQFSQKEDIPLEARRKTQWVGWSFLYPNSRDILRAQIDIALVFTGPETAWVFFPS